MRLAVRSPAALVAYRAFSDIAGKGAFFLITVAAARRLSQQAFGVFSLASTLGWIAAVASDFGIQLHLARAVARRPGDADRLLRVWLRVRLWTAAVALVSIGVGLAATGAGGGVAPAILLFALVYLVSGLIEFLHYFYRGLSRSDVESSLTLWQRLGTLGCVLVALAWRPDVTTLAVAMMLPVVATFAYSVRRAIQLGRSLAEPLVASGFGLRVKLRRTAVAWAEAVGGTPIRLEPDTARAAPSVGQELRRDIAPIGVGIVLSALYFRIDVFLIELWNGTEPVALYNAVFRMVEALRLFPAAVLAVALPSLCRANDTRLLVQLSAAVTVFAAAVTIVLWTGAAWLVPFLYGARYGDAVPAFRILLVSFPLMSLNYALTHQLIGWNGQRAYAVVSAAALVFNVALNARLIPALSIVGAAWATFWTEVLLTLGCTSALWMGAARPSAGELPVTVAPS